jgi:hypothetical protein
MPLASYQGLLIHLAGVLGQAFVAAVVAEGQLAVVEAQQEHDRGAQVVDVRLVLGSPQADFVGRSNHVKPGLVVALLVAKPVSPTSRTSCPISFNAQPILFVVGVVQSYGAQKARVRE